MQQGRQAQGEFRNAPLPHECTPLHACLTVPSSVAMCLCAVPPPMQLEFAAAYHRLCGKRVLFGQGFHCTGMPIKVLQCTHYGGQVARGERGEQGQGQGPACLHVPDCGSSSSSGRCAGICKHPVRVCNLLPPQRAAGCLLFSTQQVVHRCTQQWLLPVSYGTPVCIGHEPLVLASWVAQGAPVNQHMVNAHGYAKQLHSRYQEYVVRCMHFLFCPWPCVCVCHPPNLPPMMINHFFHLGEQSCCKDSRLLTYRLLRGGVLSCTHTVQDTHCVAHTVCLVFVLVFCLQLQTAACYRVLVMYAHGIINNTGCC